MPPRFICPRCHHSIDPLTLDTADGVHSLHLVCPKGDEPAALSNRHEDTSKAAVVVRPTAAYPTFVAESIVP